MLLSSAVVLPLGEIIKLRDVCYSLVTAVFFQLCWWSCFLVELMLVPGGVWKCVQFLVAALITFSG